MNAPETGADGNHATDAGAARNPPDHARLRQLAGQQAALRRVATLIAGGARPANVSTAVADEVVAVDAEASGGMLRRRVRDDGIGGADPVRSSGLTGLKDRIEALGGIFSLHSTQGGGTAVSCELPVPAESGQPDAGHDQ